MKIFYFLLALLFTFQSFGKEGIFHGVSAVNMDSSRFKIESANIEVAGDNKSSSGYELADTVGQVAANQYLLDGYVVKSGFQYLNIVTPFRFSISNINIALGTLAPNVPSAVTTNLIIHYDGAGQYQVTGIEEGPLKTQSGNVIPDTSCNGEVNTCSQSMAKIWSSTSAYGFGYNMSGDDIPTDFINPAYYRPFPDQAAKELPASVMESINIKKNRQSTVTFKTNVSSIQQAGSYQTVVNFTATPSY